MERSFTPTDVFRLLADETRLRIALLVERETELCVCELTAALNLSQPKISRHLAQMRTTGLLADRRQGQWVFYRLHPDLPSWVREVLMVTDRANPDWLVQDAQRLQQMGERPARTVTCCE